MGMVCVGVGVGRHGNNCSCMGAPRWTTLVKAGGIGARSRAVKRRVGAWSLSVLGSWGWVWVRRAGAVRVAHRQCMSGWGLALALVKDVPGQTVEVVVTCKQQASRLRKVHRRDTTDDFLIIETIHLGGASACEQAKVQGKVGVGSQLAQMAHSQQQHRLPLELLQPSNPAPHNQVATWGKA